MTSPVSFQTQRRSDVRDTAWWSPFSYVAKRLRALITDLVGAAGLAPGARIIDYGCADRPYERDMPPGITYLGADLEDNPDADVVLRTDGSIDVGSDTFDLVLSTQVLEHVPDPARYLRECFRVARPGGTLVLTTHGIMYYHRDPEDYWRWMRPGLQKIVEDAGFIVEEVRGVMGLAAAAIQLFQDGTYYKVPAFGRRPYALIMQLLIALFDRAYSEQTRVDNALVLGVRATKPVA